jgi:deoxyribose-phosphate aldolase
VIDVVPAGDDAESVPLVFDLLAKHLHEGVLVMLEAIRDFYRNTGQIVGMKPAGGIRKAKQAIQYLVLVKETLGAAWLTPEWFRFGASTLANDLLMQIVKQETGIYQGADYFSND